MKVFFFNLIILTKAFLNYSLFEKVINDIIILGQLATPQNFRITHFII